MSIFPKEVSALRAPLNSGVGPQMKHLVISLLYFLSFNVAACSCTFELLDNDVVRDAQQIFVFQLLSAKVDPQSTPVLVAREVVGEIHIVDTLRGDPRAKRIRYSTSICCGSRLDVGQFYVAFLSTNASEFLGNTGNILNLGELTINQTYDARAPIRQRLVAVASGRRTLEQEFGKFPNEKMFTLPRPPDPCPRSGSR